MGARYEMYNILEEVKKSEHPGASYLRFFRELMIASFVRLLELGLDVSDLSNPRVIAVSAARGPKTRTEGRRWEAEMGFHAKRYVSSFSAVAGGVHVVRSAVGDGSLAEVLARCGLEPVALSGENSAASSPVWCLDDMARACMCWFLAPAGAMKAAAADLETECCNRMLYAFEINPLIHLYRQGSNDKLLESERLAAINTAAGWSRANLSWTGKPGDALRRAVDEEYERFLEELPSASLIAWRDREPEEPLRSTGCLEKNLARRAAASIEKVGNEDATRPGKLVHDAFGPKGQEEAGGPVGEVIGSHDELLDEVELRLTAEQELNQFTAWGEKAKLSEQERRVRKLDVKTNLDTAAVAHELGVSAAQVRNVRKHYRDKIGKIRKAAGL